MLKSGIILSDKEVFIENDKLFDYLRELVSTFTDEEKRMLEEFEGKQLVVDDNNTLRNFFTQYLGYTIIYNNWVFFPSHTIISLNKVEYVKNGYHLEKMSKVIYENGRFKRYVSEIERTIEREGFHHSNSLENGLPFWYPRTKDIGFRVPETISIPFTRDEVRMLQRGSAKNIDESSLLARIEDAATTNNFDLNRELFLRLGDFSNKFNFDTCHIKTPDEIYSKFLKSIEDIWYRLEWVKEVDLALREFIKANNNRNTIYNGMPLNTEFRVFYDFDAKELLGIVNYWDTDTMLDNLSRGNDLSVFVNEAHLIESEFNEKKSFLEDEVNDKLKYADLKGKWSIDFLFTGSEFVLIDMAHAECSYYYDQILEKKFAR